nr:MAG TPA: hypothetical protein [Caudoviricetes sp.]DAS26214.1 MAG TPA: hypothetical protein [Caudoviricetes sp.]
MKYASVFQIIKKKSAHSLRRLFTNRIKLNNQFKKQK